MLEEEITYQIRKRFQHTTTVQNSTMFYTLAEHYHLTDIESLLFCYINGCFQMIAESKNFFELDFHAVYKIVSSSKLNIHSEIELLNASISWLKHNIKIRRKFAKKILLKVRLHLVPNRTLTHLPFRCKIWTLSTLTN